MLVHIRRHMGEGLKKGKEERKHAGWHENTAV